jgi:hypothetical protein
MMLGEGGVDGTRLLLWAVRIIHLIIVELY